jgi:hypothetical protein
VGAVHKAGKDVVHENGKQEKNHVYGFAEGVEKHADGGKQPVSYPQRGGYKIHEKSGGQK